MGMTTAKASGSYHVLVDKPLSRNLHRVLSPTHQRAINEESKVTNRDWIQWVRAIPGHSILVGQDTIHLNSLSTFVVHVLLSLRQICFHTRT